MGTRGISRRRFLIAGCGGLCLVLAGCSEAVLTTCPYGEVNDPYPGRCHRYYDGDGDGICDLSQTAASSAEASVAGGETAEVAAVAEEATPTDAATVEATATETAQPTATTAATATATATAAATSTATVKSLCPRGLTYDPYPGRCHRYVDKDGDGYCDLSVVV